MALRSSLHVRIHQLLQSPDHGQETCIRGWVRTKRSSKGIAFININDGSTQSGIQVIADSSLSNHEEVFKITTGSSVEVFGKLVISPAKGQKYEIQASQIKIYNLVTGDDYPLQKKRHSLEFLREIAHLRPRTNTLGSVFRIRNTLSYAVHQFFQERNFLYLHSPIITASDTEGAGELFQVTTLPLNNLPYSENKEIDYSQDFFGEKVGLTVSGQLAGESFATAFSDIYTFGPTFRAENSNTSRHLAEFWMIEPEMSFCDLEDNANLAEEFLKDLIQTCLDQHLEDLEFFEKFYQKGHLHTLESIVASSFKHLTYTEAIAILEKASVSFEFPVQWGIDLQSEHERYLAENYCQGPVVLTDYPKERKAFYMKLNPDQKTVAAMDIVFPSLGEIIGGSQREERYDVLVERMKALDLSTEEYWWYLDLRKFGSVPHSGFGLGFERLIQCITALPNIRDVIPFPRVPRNAKF